jgi:site-specific recombinase XerD
VFEQLRRQEAAPTPDLSEILYDRRGAYRSRVTYPGYHRGRPGPTAGRKYPPEVLTPEEVYKLMAACGRGPCGKRYRAMLMVGWRCGLRCSEVLDLRPKDVDLHRGTVTVLHGKGDKSRIVAIDPAAAAVVQQWIDARAQLGVTGSQPLFCVVAKPSRGERMHSVQVRILMKRLAERAGIEKRCHFHGLRHSYAAYLMDQGVPIHYIKRMLGHSSIAITERYCDHINPVQVVEHVRALEWPAAA